jgi:RNA polymerase sigma-70 factor (ECF subfamily)
MAQRLARAKRKIKAARIPYRVPEEHELPDRLRPVLAVVYLVYNAGLSGRGESGLCSEAIRLARILARLMPDEPEAGGLLALLLLTESRRASRTLPDGSLVLLGEQDRRRWDRALIEEGQAIVRRCLRRNQPGAYQIQAAINAVHADAATVEETDWSQIVALYDQLLAVAPTPVVALNRAIAIGEVQGPAAALGLVDELDLDSYYRSTPREPICFGGWGDTARPRPPTSAPPPWRRRRPSETSSGSVGEVRGERTTTTPAG